MFVVKYRKIFFALSALLILLSAYGIFKYGFNVGVDFRGGSQTQVVYQGALPDKSAVETKLNELGLGTFSVRPTNNNSYTVTTKELTDSERNQLVQAMSVDGSQATLEQANTVGPVAGTELKGKAEKAVAVVIIMIVLFITFAFRKVSKPVASWKYGLATVIALLHDVIIPTGLFVFLGHFKGVEIDLLFVTGLLAILGYSVHDTIVVFDRVRENLKLNAHENKKEPFEETVGKSVKQTFGRSINTSLTIFIVLLVLFLVGSVATKDFSLLLMIGVVVGTYSSIFVASPLLITFNSWQRQAK